MADFANEASLAHPFAARGAAIHVLHGIPSRMPLEALSAADARGDHGPFPEISLNDVRARRWASLGQQAPGARVDLLLWGDSHAMALIPVLEPLCREYAIDGAAITNSANAPLLDFVTLEPLGLKGEAPAFARAVVEVVKKERIHDVILAALWSRYLPRQDLKLGDTPEGSYREALLKTVRALQQAGARVWIVNEVPTYPINVPLALARTRMFGTPQHEVELPRSIYNERIKGTSSAFEAAAALGARILEPADHLPGTALRFAGVGNGRPLYRDSNHLSTFGALHLRPLFQRIFLSLPEAMLRNPPLETNHESPLTHPLHSADLERRSVHRVP